MSDTPEKYACPRCVADPQPAHFGSPRNCAFDAAGQFTPDNWNCATITALLDHQTHDIAGVDETMQIIPAAVHPNDECEAGDPDLCRGFIVLNRYKHRGKTSSAMYLGDFTPAPLTIDVVESTIAYRQRRAMLAISGGRVQ